MRYFVATLFAAAALSLGVAAAAESVRVMSFNVWVGGGDPGTERFKQTAAVLKKADAHLVGLQEAGENTRLFAEAAGYPHHDIERQILSRFPILERLPRARGGGAVRVALPDGREGILVNVHLRPYPYGPYDLLREKTKSVEEVVLQEKAPGGNQHMQHVEAVLRMLRREADEDTPIFWTGDFNVPSHLDWGEDNAANNGGIVAPWPVSKRLQARSFQDAYRLFRPNPVTHRGLTWTPSKPLGDPEEVHDRIDFVYFRGSGIALKEALVLGEDEALAEMAFEEWPSDHRAVLAEFSLEPSADE